MKAGDKASKNFVLKKQIISLDEFWEVLQKEKSLHWRKVLPTAFFFSWTIKTIKTGIDHGMFWSIEKITN